MFKYNNFIIKLLCIKQQKHCLSHLLFFSKSRLTQMETNGVNYYKGVLLCSRPNQSPSINRQKPFCGRVNVQEQVGLVPTKQYGQHKTVKRTLPVLNNHKKWLQKFKKQLEQKRHKQLQQEQKKEQYLQKLREQGRQRIKQVASKQLGLTQQATRNPQSKSQQKSPQKAKQSSQPLANPHKKKAKPAWAQTQQEAQDYQQNQVDQLLQFFEKGNTQQVKDYLSDDDVKKVLYDLKGKIETLKQQGGEWKNKQLIKIEDQKNRQSDQEYNKDGNDDILSRISKHSAGQSVTSQKTVERVQQLEKKKQTKQWENLSVSSSKKSSLASVDQQIAKHIADQILRNYPNLKHHSNQSIRKLLQKQAKQQLKST